MSTLAYPPLPMTCGNRAKRPRRPELDAESRSWLKRLRADDPTRSEAVAELYDRLRREAAFHIRYRVTNLAQFPRSDIEDLATQAAGDALLALLRKLDDYRGDSQFWTWARRFAELEAPVSIRRRLGHDRVGISRDPDLLDEVVDPGRSVHDRAEVRELLREISDVVTVELTGRQRRVLMATVDGVPTPTLAAELEATPGAIYKCLHDARVKLRQIAEPG